MLVSCDEDRVFGSYLPNYDDYEPEVDEKLTLNLYIITDDMTAENAKDTVALNINLYTTRNYNTELKVHYLTAAKYQSKVTEEVNASDADSANIVLVNSFSMMQNLLKSDKLVDLSGYLKTDEYGPLNVNIAPALLESAKIDDKIFAIPNNHVVGEYEYLLIDKWANDEYKVVPPSLFNNDLGPADLEGFDALVAELEEKITAAGKNPDDYIKTAKGPYEMQESLEADGKYECVVVKNPTVDASVVFSSAFAIVDRGEDLNERAMEMIFAINMDKGLRDLLQYGVADINYRVEGDNIVRIDTPTTNYKMNLIYTGNVFTASYSTEIGWTKTAAENGKRQNMEAVSE
jgi:hypothetical protein